MNRRNFLFGGLKNLSSVATSTLAAARPAAKPARWRLFEITTRIHVLEPSGPTRVWVPLPLNAATPFQRLMSNTYEAEAGQAAVRTVGGGTMLIAAHWPAGVSPVLSITNRVMTRDYTVDVSAPARDIVEQASALSPYLKPTSLQPIDGIVGETARTITQGAGTDLEKARAIYDWIVDNTFRDPKTRGCGTGDIRFMLESRDLGGKCADINALYVGLARGAGLPARDAYGVRVAPSARGFRSLGLGGDDATHAQHCRAEVYLRGYGWVPVDPADVRKVALEEPPGHLSMDSEPVRRARALLFGSWEMNWVAYNFSHDVVLPGATGIRPLGFLMYPQCETGGQLIDCLSPDTFEYRITAREVTAA
ncbi:MAG: transglutaminase domain-containing protein [Acidobacteriota bacterium]|nr:transglutaminase domain-containing protein [Acidobacteriota bacterium]